MKTPFRLHPPGVFGRFPGGPRLGFVSGVVGTATIQDGQPGPADLVQAHFGR